MLHLVQAEEGYVTAGRHRAVRGAARPVHAPRSPRSRPSTRCTSGTRSGDYHVGVCTNTLCAVLGGDAIFAALKDHLGVGNDETTAGRQGHPRARRVQRGLRLRAGRDGQLGVLRQPDRRVGARSWSTGCAPATRCARPAARGSCTFREVERVLAGFPDGLAGEGPAAGPARWPGSSSRASAATPHRRCPAPQPARRRRTRRADVQLTPVLSANWDEADAFTLAGYERHDGYQALRSALGAAPRRARSSWSRTPACAAVAAPASRPA